jgi:phthalate 4,5-dioxygenase oxygenase subunit
VLTRADNETLTRVGAGTPMGELMRAYWIPALLAGDLDGPDAPPVRVRLLGESLIAFRAADGGVALLAEHCPHRGASLWLGRPEGDGIRCAYHGWKFDADGRCRDMPNEPPECRFADAVRTTAYACREREGVVWAYLGAPPAPPLPAFEWNLPGSTPPFLWRMVRECSWLQALEGDIDAAHVHVLHATLDDDTAPTVPGARMPGSWSHGMRLARRTGAPRLAVVDTPAGVLYSARRALGDGREYHRVHPFLFPFHTMVGGGLEDEAPSFNGKAWVPMDDARTLVFEWQLRPGRPWTAAERAELARIRNPHGFLPPIGEAGGEFRPRAHRGNDYLRDRALERDRLFLGILSNPLQDAAVQESMGAIVDRTREHLGPADAMIVRVRERLLAAARAWHAQRTPPPGRDTPEAYRVRPVGAVLPPGADWVAATRARREVGAT